MIAIAIVEIPNSPIFAKLQQRNDGIYLTLFSKKGPCPAPALKMKAQGWEQAQTDAQEMLTGFRRIMSTSIAKTARAALAKRFGNNEPLYAKSALRKNMKPNLLPVGPHPGFAKLKSQPGVFRCKLRPERKKRRNRNSADYAGVLLLSAGARPTFCFGATRTELRDLAVAIATKRQAPRRAIG